MGNTIKSNLFFYLLSAVIFLNFIGIYFNMSRSNYNVLLLSHITVFVIYILNIKNILKIINHKLFIIFFCFVFFSILINNIINVSFYPSLHYLAGYKLFFVNILHNFFMGGLFVFFFKHLDRSSAKIFFLFFLFIVLFSLVLITIDIFSINFEKNISRVILKGNNNLYQTFSDYFFRLIIILLFLNDFLFDRTNKKTNIILSISIIFGIILTSIVGSVKGPVLLFSILVYTLYKTSRYFKYLIIFPVLYFFLNYDLLEFFNPRVLSSGLDSLWVRLEFLNGFWEQFSLNPIFGTVYAHDILDTDYIHSSILSSFVGLGFFGGMLFCIINYNLFLRSFNLGKSVTFIMFMIIPLSIIATYFDWFLFWFFCGIVFNSDKNTL